MVVRVGLGSLLLGTRRALWPAGLKGQFRGASLPALTVAALAAVSAGSAPAGHAHQARSGAPTAVLSAAAQGLPGSQHTLPTLGALGQLRQAGLFVVSPQPLPASALAAVQHVRGVRLAQSLTAASVRVDGKYVAMLGVDPAQFRVFADRPTARDTLLWQGVAAGDLAISYTMGRQDGLPVGSLVQVIGQHEESVAVGGVGTVGIPGVDAVVSTATARSLGFPMGNAIVVSVARSRISKVSARIRTMVPKGTAVEPLVSASAGGAGTVTVARPGLRAWTGQLLGPTVVRTFLRAALSRVGMPYVWGGDGPSVFDCSGLVQWSLAQAGVGMPRVAADQALTGPAVPVSRLEPGDLLFYHTDPTAPGYVSHVAIYLGNGEMEQAPEPGMDVEVVPADFGSEFAGAVAVSPRVAASVAAAPVG